MTQLKDTAAFEDLQRIICNEIAGVYLARLKEIGVPGDRLEQVSYDICYDIVSATKTIGEFEIPCTDILTVMHEEKTDNITLPAASNDEIDFSEERTDRIVEEVTEIQDQPSHHVEGVLSREKVLQILNAQKAAIRS